MNTLPKVLCTLLNNKLAKYCNKQQLINHEQIGFQINNRTNDHILTLKAVVNKYVVDQKGKKNCIPVLSISKRHLTQSGMKAFLEKWRTRV